MSSLLVSSGLSNSFEFVPVSEQYHCQRCGGPLKPATYFKYEGHSAQCLAKKRAEEAASLAKPVTRKITLPKIKIYSFKEFCYLWALKDPELARNYFLKYLLRIAQARLEYVRNHV